MKAVVFHGIGDIRLDEVPAPKIKEPTDAIVRITASAICGTDLHMVRGTMAGMEPGTIMGHEGVGFVEEVGSHVRNIKPGDRVVIPSTIACGYCVYCRAGYYSQCDNANPNGKRAGTAFFGGPKSSGPFNGLQAEKARIPFANTGLVKLPKSVSDDQAILISDIFPTGYFGAEMAEITPGDTVAVFGCGPVGQFAIASAKMFDAGRVIAVDQHPSRLEMAREFGAETINFNEEDPVAAILELTGGIGVDRVIDAVGIESESPSRGPAAEKAREHAGSYRQELKDVASESRPGGDLWKPGDAPTQAFLWEIDAIAKAGTLSIIGVYPPTMKHFPIGQAMMKNLTINAGNCSHRKYIPTLIEMVQGGTINPARILTQIEPLSSIMEAYETFDQREPNWIKVEIVPGM